ncbi:MAG: LysM peptidoglycan-binding domain-containing protein [Gaiellales bacterium]
MFVRRTFRSIPALSVALLLTIALVLGHASASAGASHPRLHTVHAGDTLWGIAVAAYPSDDPRDAIYRIEQANHLATASISPGQELQLP